MKGTRRSRRTLGGAAAVAAAAGLLATGCTGSEVASPPLLGVAARLVAFDSCDQLLDWFHDEAGQRVTAYGLEGSGGPVAFAEDAQSAGAAARSSGDTATAGTSAAPTAAPSFSTTNVQEAGVGEPDLAVTDGARLVSVVGGTLRVVDVSGPSPTVTGELDLPDGSGQLLVDGDHALVLSQGYGPLEPMDDGGDTGGRAMIAPAPTALTTLTQVDLDGTPRVVGSVSVDAGYVDARMVDGVVRVVTRSGPEGLGFVYPSGSSASEQRSLAANRRVVAETGIDDWLPSLSVTGPDGGTDDARPAVECGGVEHPQAFSGFDVVTVLGLDLRADGVELLPSAAVVAGAGTVYASSSTLYVTTERWPDPATTDGGPADSAGGGSTGTAMSGPAAASPGAATDVAPSAAPDGDGATGSAGAEPAAPTTTTAKDSPTPTPSSTPTTATPTTSTTSTSTSTTSTTVTPIPPVTSVGPPTTAPGTTLPPPVPGVPVEQGPYTDVHAFAIGGRGAADYLASGRVRGTVLDQFSLSEHEGRLRVATTVGPGWWGWRVPTTVAGGRITMPPGPTTSESYVTVLERSGEELTRVGEVGGLGRGEQIYSARFVGDLGYVVTFRRTDPLYVVDLRDPARPTVAGELKIPGYSSYLQQIGEGRLLGVGQDATDQGRVTGFAESLFDVADPAAPARLAQLTVPRSSSLAEEDHHALLWWSPTQMLVVPLQGPAEPMSDGRRGWFSGVLVSRVADDGITELARLEHPGATYGPGSGVDPSCPPNVDCLLPEPLPGPVPGVPIERALVAGDRLVTVSAGGVMVNDLTTLAQQSWTPFSS